VDCSEVEPTELDAAVTDELELAWLRHRPVKDFAPLSCKLAGVAVERLRGCRGELDEVEATAYLNEVRQ
jgi:hypothetical protein